MQLLQLISTKINIDYSVKTNALIHIVERKVLLENYLKDHN